jgi:hypothetical protein
MFKTGFLSWAQYEILTVYSGSRYKDFVGIHAGSLKEPDAGVLVDGRMINGYIPNVRSGQMKAHTYSDPKTNKSRTEISASG